ncbi:Cda5 [Cordylochernes scorpioides]|uniref:Cda5 n=1 Tax=Cordylochernes scorpioides TaxID=51811 RepID=A0ABY6K1R2_9ARAC|nr:Cda5 [Cordylochernes scorpioides]
MKSLRCLHASPSQQSQCSLSWVCKAAALGLCQFSARLRPLLGMRYVGTQAASNVPTEVFSCPDQFGYYPDMEDCSKYFVCVFGDALHESCTGGLYFSAELQTCDWPRNVQCATEPQIVHHLYHSNRSLSWMCKAAAFGPYQISARLRPLLDMRIWVGCVTGVKPATPKTQTQSGFNRKHPRGGESVCRGSLLRTTYRLTDRGKPPHLPSPQLRPPPHHCHLWTATTKRDPIYAAQDEDTEEDDQFDLQQPQYGEAAPPVVDSEGGIHLSEGNLDPISGVSIYVKPIFPNSNTDKSSSSTSRNKGEASKFDDHLAGGGRAVDSSRFINFPPSLRTGVFNGNNNNGRPKDPDVPSTNPGTTFDQHTQFDKTKETRANDEGFLRHDPNDPSNIFTEARKSMDSEMDKVLLSNNGRSGDTDIKDDITRNEATEAVCVLQPTLRCSEQRQGL